MPKGDKYQDLTRYLIECNEPQIVLTFDKVAEIVGGLPPSAYSHSAQLWNDGSGGSLSYGWLNADYSAKLLAKEKKVIFTRKKESSTQLNSDPLEKKIDTLSYSQTEEKTATFQAREIVSAAQRYYDSIVENSYTRLRSWEHCRRAFLAQYSMVTRFDADYLSLQLAWYLASWGMLQKSALVRFDHLVHKDLVIELSKLKYQPLFQADGSQESIALTLETAEIISLHYQKYWQNTGISSLVTDTLISKILLGVFGCTPALDKYFTESAKTLGIAAAQISSRSLRQLWNYYQRNESTFQDFRDSLSIEARELYTPMKCLDMGLWQLGIEKGKEDRLRSMGG